MGRRKNRTLMNVDEGFDFLNNLLAEKPYIPLLIPLILFFWVIEKWILSLSNWVPLVLAVWVAIQYGHYRHRIVVEDLNKKWKRVILSTSPTTPLEHCEWLNKLLIEIWSNFMNPKLSSSFQYIVEKRLKHRKSRLIEKLELLEFSVGSSPPCLGLHGTQWTTSGDQRVMRLGFDWDTTDISIMLLAKVAKPFFGTAKIVINSLHIKGDLLLMPILNGKSILYSFISTPEVRITVAFGSGGSQSLPATELPGVSSWLVKLLSDALAKTMVEPRRNCFSLPAVNLGKKAVGGIVYVSIISASKLSRSSLRGSPSKRQPSFSANGLQEQFDNKDLLTFVEVELGELTRRTTVRPGSSPRWDSTFNMVLHDSTGIIRFHLYECTPGSVKYDYLASCEVKMRYVGDDSTTFWAIGPDSSVIARHSESCGKEVEMVLPFEGANAGELAVRLVVKEWQFSDGSLSFNNVRVSPQPSLRSSNFLTSTGRKINVAVVEGKDLITKDNCGKCNPYVKLHYGKVLQKTKTAHFPNMIWNQKFEFDEIGGGEYLKINCYTEDVFGDESIGSARVSLEGLVEGSVRDVWVPLEKVNSGELRIRIDAVNTDDIEEPKSYAYPGNGLIELVLLEARDLVAADLRGTSDPYVRVQYGKNLKRRTKVMYKTLSPKWYQTFEFPDDGSPLELHVKDHNALLPTSSIGSCVVEYHRLPPNEMSDKWIPLQGVKRGEIHIQVTRKFPELQKRPTMDPEPSLSKAHRISTQMKQMMIKLESLTEDGNLEGVSGQLSELETLQDMQEEYMVHLESEQALLLNKITELGQEIFYSPPSLTRTPSPS